MADARGAGIAMAPSRLRARMTEVLLRGNQKSVISQRLWWMLVHKLRPRPNGWQ